MIRKTNAQSISRFLRGRGYTPSSAGDSSRRWPGLLCRKSAFDEVSIRVWSNFELDEPSEEDRKTAADIAELLGQNGYRVRYTSGDYRIYVEGKEI